MVIMAENPMFVPELLSHIFDYCNQPDLANCRLVSKFWYDTSLPRWRSKVRLNMIVSDTRRGRKYKEFFGTPSAGSMNPMLELDQHPYRRIRIVGVLSCEEEDGHYFWDTFGPRLHELFIDSPTHKWKTAVNPVLFHKTPNLRKLILKGTFPVRVKNRSVWYEVNIGRKQNHLKSLEIRTCDWIMWPSFNWGTFMSYFPKLEEVTFPPTDVHYIPSNIAFPYAAEHFNGVGEISYCHSLVNLVELLEAVKHFRYSDWSNFCITQLNMIPKRYSTPLHFHYNNHIFKLLQDLQLPLKTLKLSMTHSPDPTNLINSYSSTLEVLVLSQERLLWDGGCRQYSPIILPMYSLHTLEIVGGLVFDFSMLQYTPTLKKLCIHTFQHSEYHQNVTVEDDDRVLEAMEDNNWDMMFHGLANVKLNHLTELHFPELRDPADVQILGEAIPVLKIFQGKVNVVAFSELCVQWGNTLKEVKFNCGSNLDDGAITGGFPGFEGRCGANITLLKVLQAFRMEKYPPHKLKNLGNVDAPLISDISVFDGFLKLPDLKYLDIQTPLKIGENCLHLLKRKGVHVTVTKIPLRY